MVYVLWNYHPRLSFSCAILSGPTLHEFSACKSALTARIPTELPRLSKSYHNIIHTNSCSCLLPEATNPEKRPVTIPLVFLFARLLCRHLSSEFIEGILNRS